MTSRPVIFISAVSSELRIARDLVAKTLLALGYEPSLQDIAATDAGDLRGVLRKWVDGSDAVLQLVGHCYGFAPETADPQFGPCSYTQYETLYARQQGKRVYYIFTDAAHPTDGCGCEPKTLHDLQAQYRQTVKAYGELYHTTSSLTQTELLVRRLKDELAKHRSRAKQVVLTILVLLAICAGGIVWNMKRGGETQQTVSHMERKVDALTQATNEFIQRNAADTAGAGGKDEATRRTLLFAELEKKHGLPAGTLERELPEITRKRAEDAAIPKLERAAAAAVARDYTEAERLALEAYADAKKAFPLDKHKLIAALGLAGESAIAHRDDKAALAK